MNVIFHVQLLQNIGYFSLVVQYFTFLSLYYIQWFVPPTPQPLYFPSHLPGGHH